MKWLNSIDKIYLVNLQKRTDRLLESAKLFEEYEIPYTVFTAIERPNGAEGLRDTMLELFKDAQRNNYDNILVFEDDVDFIVEKFWLHDTMNNVMKQLPESYHLCYLGGQPTGGYSSFYSPNLLPAIKYYSTQSVMYSKQGVREILALGMGFPIDNWLVDELQTLGRCFAIHPILTTQRAGWSDIGRSEMDWSPFIEPIHNQKVADLIRKW